MKLNLFFTLLVFPMLGYSQPQRDSESNAEIKMPNGVFASSVLIETDACSGSGFYLSDSLYIYFITARHVLFDTLPGKRFKLNTKNVRLTSYHKDIVSEKPSIIKIDLQQDFNKKLLRFDSVQDIAVVIVAALEHFKKDTNIWISIFNGVVMSEALPIPPTLSFSRHYKDVNIGDDIYLVGYPRSIGLKEQPQFDISRPLLRKGIIAGKYEKKKTIIIDSPSYWGNSGGPVLEVIRRLDGSMNAQIIGVVSEYIPYVKSTKTDTLYSNTGYAIVTSIDYALDLIKKFK